MATRRSLQGRTTHNSLTPEAGRVMYVGLGSDRSLTLLHKLVTDTGITIARSTLANWSRRYGWVLSAAEFDAKQRQAVTVNVALRDAIVDNGRQAQFGRAFQELALLGIATKRTDEFGRPVNRVDLTGTEIARLGEVGIKIERLASGEATERIDMMSAAMRVITEQVGPAVRQLVGEIDQVCEGLPPEHAQTVRDAMAGAVRRMALEVDRVIDSEFRAYGLSLDEASGDEDDE